MIASEQDARDAAEFRRVLASSLTTTEAAALCGMLPSSFRGAMTRERARGNDFRTASRPVVLWSEAQLRWWISCGRPGRGRRTHESPRPAGERLSGALALSMLGVEQVSPQVVHLGAVPSFG